MSDATGGLRTENDNLRRALAVSKDPCGYCQLPAAEMAKCLKGFPGCDRADDMAGCPFEGDSMMAAMWQDRLTSLVDLLLYDVEQGQLRQETIDFARDTKVLLTRPK